ncbi:hypothetical protein LXA43DRAFT_975059 [Ganoderma leucocontextum]|nr:hypothetical protein LXA43DRAFT_975059 [Ganoderma leucocontextum]
MAYLVRRRDTHLMRVLLLPTVIAMTVRCTFRYQWKDTYYRWYEWNRGLMGLVVIAKSVDFALAKEGRFRVKENGLPAIYEPEQKPSDLSQSDLGKNVPHADVEDRGIAGKLLPRALYDALEIGLAMRGVGWDFGRSLYIPSGEWPSERNAFIKAKLWNFTRNELYVDVWETIEKLTPGVSSNGGTIFLPHLPPLQRYAYSTFLQLGHGLLIVAGMSNVYDMFSLIGVLLCGSKPEDWPSMMGDLWAVRSLHEFWSQGWHQALRYTFLTYGGFPGRWLAGSGGMVFGTFLASALFHEIGIATTGIDVDRRVLVFFLLQAIGITMEKVFRMLTGIRVGGVLGFAWAALFILGFGQMCTDSWFNRGIGGAMAVPETLSIGRQIILPTIRGLVHLFAF